MLTGRQPPCFDLIIAGPCGKYLREGGSERTQTEETHTHTLDIFSEHQNVCGAVQRRGNPVYLFAWQQIDDDEAARLRGCVRLRKANPPICRRCNADSILRRTLYFAAILGRHSPAGRTRRERVSRVQPGILGRLSLDAIPLRWSWVD
jgi:hypothetical protein